MRDPDRAFLRDGSSVVPRVISSQTVARRLRAGGRPLQAFERATFLRVQLPF
jgi:hypothetical protein